MITCKQIITIIRNVLDFLALSQPSDPIVGPINFQKLVPMLDHWNNVERITLHGGLQKRSMDFSTIGFNPTTLSGDLALYI